MSNGKEVVDVPAPDRKPRRGRKPRQELLPGQEPQAKIAAIHDAIEAYVEVRDNHGLERPGGAAGELNA